MIPWSIDAQKRRRSEIMDLIRIRYRQFLDCKGENDRLIRHDQPREGSRAAIAFLCSDKADDIAFGNVLLRRVHDKMPLNPMPHPFEASTYAGLLSNHESHLEPDVLDYVRTKLESLLPAGMTRDFQFHGYNDNMPVMWTWALQFGGEYFGRDDFLKIAHANAMQLRDLFQRRGAVSEYGAGYCCHRLPGWAYIAEFTSDYEIRQLALDIEERVWAELAGHWNPRLAQVCGASMRGDMRQGVLFSPENYALFYYVFGKGLLLDNLDWRDYFNGEPETIQELGLDPKQYAFSGGLALGAEFCEPVYHVSEKLASLFYDKPVPFIFQCSAETNYNSKGHTRKKEPVYGKGGVIVNHKFLDETIHIPNFPAAPAHRQDLTTWHGCNVSLGTSTVKQFGSGNHCRCHYLREPEPSSRAALGSVHVRFNINDKTIGAGENNVYWKTPEICEEQKNRNSMYDDMGQFHSLQSGPAALCHYAPLALEYWNVSSLKCDIMFDERDAQVKTVRFNGNTVREFPFCSEKPGVITIDEGATFLAIHPLIESHLQRKAAVKIIRTGEFLIISFYNYEGPAIEFSHYEIAKLGNGFVFEVRDAGTVTFEKFEQQMLEAKILDMLYTGTRRIHYFRENLRLSLGVCPHTDSVMFESINGFAPERPKISFSDGTEKGLPFMSKSTVNGFEDYEWLKTQFDRPTESYNPVD